MWWLFFSSFGKSHGQKFNLKERKVYKEKLTSQKKQERKAREIAKRIKNQQGMIPSNMGCPTRWVPHPMRIQHIRGGVGALMFMI